MTKLTIHVPQGKEDSKCWYVFNPVLNGGWGKDVVIDHDYISKDGDAMFWGFVGGNFNKVKECVRENRTFYFSDMPYFGRWTGLKETDPNTDFYWRIIKNKLHMNEVKDLPDKRWKKFGIDLKEWNDKGEEILVCPSSPTMTQYYYSLTDIEWMAITINKLKKITDRPIRIRNKPRMNGRSGPDVAKIPFQEDIKNAWAVITSVSICAVEAAINGIPVFCNKYSPAAPIGLDDINLIETPIYPERQKWLNTLCHSQYTPNEIRSGYTKNVLEYLDDI